jgi:hypothetical protein
MSDQRRSTSVPDGVPHDPDDERDLPGERLDNDFDVASAREQNHEENREQNREQRGSGHAADDPSEAPDVVDGS